MHQVKAVFMARPLPRFTGWVRTVTSGVLGCIQKRLQVLRGAAVVYQKYILKPLLQQPLHHQHELLIRVQGGDDHGYVHG